MRSSSFLLTGMFFLFFHFNGNAQAPGKNEIKIKNDLNNHHIGISFSADKEVASMLVMVSDSTGQTIFLDNRIRFSGSYSKDIDLITYGKGSYNIKVIRDDDQFDKKFKVD